MPEETKDHLDKLSERERQIAERYAEGQTYKVIAEALFLSPSTIRSHLNKIYQKLGISSKAELFQLVANPSTIAPPPGQNNAAASSTAPQASNLRQADAVAEQIGITRWLKKLGLEQYAGLFAENAIDETVLLILTDEDLHALGVQAVGHRKKLSQAIAELDYEADTGSRPSDESAIQAERRPLTALVAQLSDISLQHQDLEVLRDIIKHYYQAVTAVVESLQGYIASRDGGTVRVYFGYPLVHEDDAERAVRSGLLLVERLHALNTELRRHIKKPLQVHIGIASGQVVVEAEANDAQSIYGAVPDFAQRIADVGAADSVTLSAMTQRLAGHKFVYAKVEPEISLGAGEQITLWRAERPSSGIYFESRSPTLTPFVGRDLELALLRERFRYVGDGQGQAVAIIGEPGIGKSRLIHEFRRGLANSNVDVFQSHCFSHSRSTPYLPLVVLLHQLCELSANDTPVTVTRKLDDYLQATQVTDDQAVPLLLQLLEVPCDTTLLRYLSPQAQRERTLSLMRRLLLYAPRPRVIVLEDLHWVDASTQQWLTEVVRQLPGASVLLLLTYRPGYRPPWLEHGVTNQLVLPHLTQRDSLVLLRSLPRALALADGLPEIAAKGSGNPFFLEELAWDTGTQHGAIPDTVQGVLAARIDALPLIDKKVLQTAAVIGVRIPVSLLTAAVELSEIEFAASVMHLQRAELLFEDYSAPQREYVFKHVLAQEVAYHSLLSEQRRTLHERIAQTLQAHFSEMIARQPDIMARHFTEAAKYDLALDYWQRAGRHAYKRSAYTEAIDYVQQGLSLLNSVSDAAQRDRGELSLQTTLGPALMAAKGYGAPLVEQALTRARTLCEQLGDSATASRVLIGLSNYYWVSGRFDQAYTTNRQLLKLAHTARDPARQLRAHAAMGELLLHAGRLRAGRRHLEHGVQLYSEHSRPTFATQTPAVACLCYSSWSLWQQGYDGQALVRAEQALALARELSHPFSLAIALCLIGELQQFRLDILKTLELTQAGADLAHQQGFPFWQGTALVLLGWAQARSGRSSQGINTIKRGLKVFRTTHAEVQLSSWYGLLAEAYGCDGQFDSGLQAVTEALGWADKTGERYYEAELYRLRGWLLAQQDDELAAETALQHAIVLARRRGTRLWQLRASCDLACLWQGQGKHGAALALLTPIFESFDEGFDAPDLRRARELMDELSVAIQLTGQ